MSKALYRCMKHNQIADRIFGTSSGKVRLWKICAGISKLLAGRTQWTKRASRKLNNNNKTIGYTTACGQAELISWTLHFLDLCLGGGGSGSEFAEDLDFFGGAPREVGVPVTRAGGGRGGLGFRGTAGSLEGWTEEPPPFPLRPLCSDRISSMRFGRPPGSFDDAAIVVRGYDRKDVKKWWMRAGARTARTAWTARMNQAWMASVDLQGLDVSQLSGRVR